MTTWTAEEISQARHELALTGIDASDMDLALTGALALAIQEVPRKRRIWPYILGLTAAACCFAFAGWSIITATAAW